jgi:Methyltransferase domain
MIIENKNCPLCLSEREQYFTQLVLKKYNVNYFFCSNCGLLQTEEPYWLEEAYQNPIDSCDTGLVSRNIQTSEKLAVVLFFLLKKSGKYLDIAGGCGILTRLMRDIGFDFYWSDAYCQNLLSRGFESSTTKPPFDVITAFEVLEHVYNPLEFIQDSFNQAQSSSLVFSTEVFAILPPAPHEWPYYIPEVGQHISFYQVKTLQFIADKLSLRLYSYGNFHLLTKKKKFNQLLWKMLVGRFSKILILYVKLVMRSKSKTSSDSREILNNFNGNQ